MPLLLAPDEVTAQSIKRLRGDSDFQRVAAWLSRALAQQDRNNRPMIDSVNLRMGQGAAVALDEIIGHVEGRSSSKGALSDTRQQRAGQGDRKP